MAVYCIVAGLMLIGAFMKPEQYIFYMIAAACFIIADELNSVKDLLKKR